MSTCIKVCGDPHCEAVYHNCPEKVTHCTNCNGWLKKVNQATYELKFKGHYFQYDYPTGEYYRP